MGARNRQERNTATGGTGELHFAFIPEKQARSKKTQDSRLKMKGRFAPMSIAHVHGVCLSTAHGGSNSWNRGRGKGGVWIQDSGGERKESFDG